MPTDKLTVTEAIDLSCRRMMRITSRKQLFYMLTPCCILVMLYLYRTSHYYTQIPKSRDVEKGQTLRDINGVLEYIGKHLDINISVLQNKNDCSYQLLTLTNQGSYSITEGVWSIYLNIIYPVKTSHAEYGLDFQHMKGYLHRMSPTKTFQPLLPGDSVQIPIKFKHYAVMRNCFFPNWYVASEGYKPVVLRSTVNEALTFVQAFTKPEQYKRFDGDRYNPYTPEQRYRLNAKTEDLGHPGNIVIPTPLRQHVVPDKILEIYRESSVITYSTVFQEEAKLLSEKLGITLEPNSGRYEFVISLLNENITEASEESRNLEEAYTLNINPQQKNIILRADTPAGAFYGVQTLLMLSTETTSGIEFPETKIFDAPRFQYRGYQVDVSRNFHKKSDLFLLLDAMARYKMNKFHFHLSDDEGWRLQIPGLEELTQVGASRCHDFREENCLLPQLGSGPNKHTSGSGYYTTEDYREILRYAAKRHIQIIPEFDMPGHGRAAIKAMELRFRRLNTTNPESASKYLLSEFQDRSSYSSVQNYNDNAINPCLESTYRFIRHLISTLNKLHHGIQPLRIYHFGGDEVARNAWSSSKACIDLQRREQVSDLKQYFVRRLSSIAYAEGYSIGAWEDGIIMNKETPIRKDMLKLDVYVNAWQNIWDSGLSNRAYILANAGYKVIMSQATHLYFDHPYEPDPEERGLIWATRYIDVHKVFGFMPDHLYRNTDFTHIGDKLDETQLCQMTECVPLQQKNNIIGLQGQLWTELIRTSEQFHYMTFPRLLALAERAWHKASWEDITMKSEREEQLQGDWTLFANTLGYQELKQLDQMKIPYRIPVPGAMITNGVLHVNAGLPGLTFQYSTDDGVNWTSLTTTSVHINNGQKILVRTCSADGQRFSRPVWINS